MATNSDIKKLTHFFRHYPSLRQAILFGSLAEGREHFNSDVDIAIQLDRPMIMDDKVLLIEKISQIMGRPVDLVDLETVGQPLLSQIMQHGQRLIGSNKKYGNLLSKCLLDHEDFMPYRQHILNERRRRWIGL